MRTPLRLSTLSSSHKVVSTFDNIHLSAIISHNQLLKVKRGHVNNID